MSYSKANKPLTVLTLSRDEHVTYKILSKLERLRTKAKSTPATLSTMIEWCWGILLVRMGGKAVVDELPSCHSKISAMQLFLLPPIRT